MSQGLLDWTREAPPEPPRLLDEWRSDPLIHPPVLGVASVSMIVTPSRDRLVYTLTYDGAVRIERWSR